MPASASEKGKAQTREGSWVCVSQRSPVAGGAPPAPALSVVRRAKRQPVVRAPLPELFYVFFLMIRRRARSTLFPYTTLFRSTREHRGAHRCLGAVPPVGGRDGQERDAQRSEEHTSELQSPCNLVCRLLLA